MIKQDGNPEEKITIPTFEIVIILMSHLAH
jgi:hypothetical protein